MVCFAGEHSSFDGGRCFNFVSEFGMYLGIDIVTCFGFES